MVLFPVSMLQLTGDGEREDTGLVSFVVTDYLENNTARAHEITHRDTGNEAQ